MNGMLLGRLALVTGAGSGIGRAVCQVFAREGARVAVSDVSENAAMETLKSLQESEKHDVFVADVSSSPSVTQMIEQIKEKFSSVPSIAGTFLVNQVVSKAMLENKIDVGSIINISSIVGKVGNIGQCNYAASKAGVIGLTKASAKELARYGIRVNAVLPGFIATPMTDAVPDKVMKQIVPLIPMERMGQPEEVAETCLFLASRQSSYITGATIEVTGGFFM
ncbi:hypothetical protein ScPMuIL_009846 [Solemya velum]